MYKQLNLLFFVSLLLVSVQQHQLFGADGAHPFLMEGLNQSFFEHGTEESNERLRCTCKALNAAGARYHDDQTARFNEKFKGMTHVFLGLDSTDSLFEMFDELKEITGHFFSWVIPTAVIYPGGKKVLLCVEDITTAIQNSSNQERRILDMDHLLEQDFVDRTANAKKFPLLSHYILGDPQKRYHISPCAIETCHLDPQKRKTRHYLCLELLPSKFTKICEITSEKNLKDNIYTIYGNPSYADDMNKERHTVTFNFIPNQALIVRTEKAMCFLAEHTLCPYVLASCSAQHEYIFSSSEIFDEESIKVPEIPLEIKKSTYINRYHLKKDSLLQDMRAQKALYTLLSKGDYILGQEIAQDVYSADELVGFYLAAILWWHSHESLVPKGSLHTLFEKQIEENKKMLLANQWIITRSIHAITELAKKPFTIAVPFRTYDIPHQTVVALNDALCKNIEEMKNKNEKPYDKYHNTVKAFVENNGKQL